MLRPDRYRQLVDQSPDGIFLTQATRITFVNQAAVRLLGAIGPEQVVGRSLFDLFRSESHTVVRYVLARLMSDHPVLPFEEKVVRVDGAVTDVEVTGALVEGEDIAAIQIILRDITERKRAEAALRESEERLTLAVAGAQEGVWDWNLETGAVVYSLRWKKMLGYSDNEIESNVSAWERLVHPDDRSRADQANEAVARGEGMYEAEFRLRHKDGHYVHVLSRGFPVRREPDGPVVRIVGTHFDLTERKRADAERSRRELLARLVFAQEDERRRIAREMHDQLGEQLTTLGRTIGALKETCRDRPELSAQVEALQAVSHQLDSDVDHLVWQLRPTALDDLGLRAALANYVQDWSRRFGIAADLHTSGLQDRRLAPDVETTLYRIAQEALNNVAKHSRAKNVDVMLERRADRVTLIVEDDGVGFDTSHENGDGEGFGLVGMQERATLVGATVQIESAVGSGTTILVRMAASTDSEDPAGHEGHG
jgi:two-component system, NarL family, sensor histidine kinase UhpB